MKDIIVRIDREMLIKLVQEGQFIMHAKGHAITDPFGDEININDVDPVSYYRNPFLLACLHYGLIKYEYESSNVTPLETYDKEEN